MAEEKDSPYSRQFHLISKRFGENHNSNLETAWPEEWTTTYYKSYPRFRKIKLTDDGGSFDLFTAIKKRKSRKEFSNISLSNKELSLLLRYSAGIPPRSSDPGEWRRAYPSAGARYPLEVYLAVQRAGKDLERGLFHYDVKHHQLDVLWDRPFGDLDLEKVFFGSSFSEAPIVVFITSVFWRNQNKYGERGYRHVLLDAGHVSQNFYLVSEALGLSCCAVGGFKGGDDEIEELLDIDGVAESLVHTLVIGKQ